MCGGGGGGGGYVGVNLNSGKNTIFTTNEAFCIKFAAKKQQCFLSACARFHLC